MFTLIKIECASNIRERLCIYVRFSSVETHVVREIARDTPALHQKWSYLSTFALIIRISSDLTFHQRRSRRELWKVPVAEIKQDGWRLHVLPKTPREKCSPTHLALTYKNLIMKIERVGRYIASRQNKIDHAPRPVNRPTDSPMFLSIVDRVADAFLSFFPFAAYPVISPNRLVAFIGRRHKYGSICYEDLPRSAVQVRASRGVTRRASRT